MGEGYFPVMNHKRPPFDLPVVYEDDHFAVCNKPAGVVVYAQRGGGHGIMTIRAALPFAVAPPKVGTVSALRRPQPVHRLDKPTSGLLLVAKTKPAMVDLSLQFRDRIVKKTYTAVVNGIPPEPPSTKLNSKEAHAIGVDIHPDEDSEWQLIDHPLDEKSAVTLWRVVKYAKSLKAQDNYVSLVELKPKTGRYHQLRRHMVRVSHSESFVFLC
jgi:23S rRNA-/tRNA-specific pseudouridylate synthase